MSYLFYISIAILCISIFLFIKISSKKIDLKQQQKEKQKLEQRINALYNYQQELEKANNQIDFSIREKKQKVDSIDNILKLKETHWTNLTNKIEKLKQQTNKYYNQQKDIIEQQLEEFKKISSKAAENYFQQLEQSYNNADAAYKQKITQINEEISKAAADLNSIKEMRQIAYQSLLKEKEVKENKDNYRLIPSEFDLQDIYTLERIKSTLHKPRTLSMLIWQTFWQPIAKKQFPIILQAKTKTGIYKITNIQTDESYIGQSTDVYKRFCQHCKAGLGIDTPVGNKLYKAMQDYGLQNFTFELICECSKQELNEKQQYFIELYQANLYGYNGNKGINK